MAAKYYAVRVGKSTGVFFTWEECQKQVIGYPGAVYKSFTTIEEAEKFVKGEELDAAAPGEETFTIEPGALAAYVDGSYNAEHGQFSYGMVLLDGEQEMSFHQFFIDEELAAMRNVAGEIKGAEAAMRYAIEHGFKKLYIYHDYEGIAKWCLGEWKTNKEGTKAYKEYFESIKDKLQVEFVKVAAHTGDKYNERADKLAKEALGIL